MNVSQRIWTKCLYCKYEWQYSPHQSFGKYCSNRCQRDYEWLLTKRKIIKTKKYPSDRIAKKFLLEKFGNKCKICKRTKWLGQPILLIMDHIDGNSRNRKPKNLRMICSNCDAQTDTYKGRNKGKGRHTRRERYQEGKSY